MRRSTVLLVLLLLLLVLTAPLARAAPSVLVRAGDPSPLGLPFSRFSDAAVDDRGRVAFVGGSTVLFTRGGDGISRIAGAGDLLLSHRIAGVGPAALAAGGCIAFRAAFAGGGAGVFTRCGETFTLVAEVGQAAPGGRAFAGFGGQVAIGAGGRVAFTAMLDDGSVGLFATDGGGFAEVVRTGAASPAGGTFSSLRLVGVSASGRVGFRASAARGPDGLFYWDGTTLLKLAVVGDASPAGGSFTALGFAAMNDAELWAFRASISSGVDATKGGVFRARTASVLPVITPVVLEGDATPIGGSFADFPNSLVPAINSSGAIAFRVTIADGSFPSGVFEALPDGTLVKMAAVREPTAAGQQLVRLREVALADDGGVVIRASLSGGTPGLFRARGGRVDQLAVLGDATDLGAGFRFTDAAARDNVEGAVFLGAREGLFIALGAGTVQPLAVLGDRTPLRGQYAGFDPPSAGGRRIVFGASIQGGRSGEALLSAGGRRPRVLAKVGDKVPRCGVITDLFADPLDELARAGGGPGSAAFQAALGGRGAASGVVLASGGGLKAVACQGRRAPGGGTYQQFGTPDVAAGGRVAFVALSRAPGGTLFRSAGSKTTPLAVGGRDTGTRLRGLFRGFDTPVVSAKSVAFRAILDQAREGVFVARGRCLMALAATGEPEPGGGSFRVFGTPAFAGKAVVFRGVLLGGTAVGLYRATPSPSCTQIPPPIETLAVAATSSSVGPLFAFSNPTGNRAGTIAFTADQTGSGPTDAIITVD